jgi:hypothetical protein
MESRNPEADATPGKDEKPDTSSPDTTSPDKTSPDKSSPDEPKTGDEHAYEDDWYKVLKRRSEQSDDSED